MSALAATNNDTQRALLIEEEAIALEGDEKFNESLDKYEELLVLQKVALGDGHCSTMATMASIMRVIEAIKDSGSGVSGSDLGDSAGDCFHDNRFEDSLLLSEQSLAVNLKREGEEHEESIKARSNIGALLNRLERFEEALKMLQKAFELESRVLGSKHELTLLSMSSIGYSLNGLKRYEESLSMYEQVLEIQSRTMGENHSDSLAS
jgi:tetratricopeptide (TPR) repeat protein